MPGKRILSVVPLLLLAIALLAAGCAPKTAAPTSHSRTSKSFAIVKTQPGDSFESLANRYLNDKGKAWLVADFNEVKTIKPGDFLVIPREPFEKGGLTDGGYQTVPVLAYNGFSAQASDSITISGQDFEKQMQYLADNGYAVISLEKFYDFLEFSDSIPRKAVVLTIDDMGQGTYDIAYPILKKFGYPATVFVCTDLVTGADNALSWDRIKQMKQDGFDIQHRTKTLRNLTRRKEAETFEDYILDVDREITVAALKFNDELRLMPRFIAYPYGAANELVVALLRKNGFRGGLTLAPGSNPFYSDGFHIKRTTITGGMTLEDFGKTLEVFVKEDLR